MDEKVLNGVKGQLSMRLRMKEQGIVQWFLGINISHTTEKILISQTSYVDKLLIRFNLVDKKSKAINITGGAIIWQMADKKEEECDYLR